MHRTTADELNARFADWYYVISDSVYEKIRIKRSDVVEVTDAGAAENTGSTGP